MVDAAPAALVEGLDFADELSHVFKLAIDRSIADVGDVIEVLQLPHDLGADDLGGNFAMSFLFELVGDRIHGELDLVHGHRPLFTGLQKSGQKLFAGEGLASPIALHDMQLFPLDGLVGGEAKGTLEALAASADGMTIPGFARVDDAILGASAFGAAHRVGVGGENACIIQC